MSKTPVNKALEATRAAALKAEPKAHRLQGPDGGQTIVADEVTIPYYGGSSALCMKAGACLERIPC